MKCQAEILLLKNKLRLMKGTLRHAWHPLLGFLIVGVALAYQLIFVVAKAGRGTAVSSKAVLQSALQKTGIVSSAFDFHRGSIILYSKRFSV